MVVLCDRRQVQLYVDVLDLLPCASCDAEAEIRRLEKLALQCNSELKRVYRHYCALGEGGVEHCFTLTIKGVRGTWHGGRCRWLWLAYV